MTDTLTTPKPQIAPSDSWHRLSVDRTYGIGTCSQCGPIKAVWHYNKWACPTARRLARQSCRTKNASKRLRRERIVGRFSSCGICQEFVGSADAHVDHDHAICPNHGKGSPWCSKCIRGVLCQGCNLGLGHFKDDPRRLLRAVEYLKDPPFKVQK